MLVFWNYPCSLLSVNILEPLQGSTTEDGPVVAPKRQHSFMNMDNSEKTNVTEIVIKF